MISKLKLENKIKIEITNINKISSIKIRITFNQINMIGKVFKLGIFYQLITILRNT